jgi:hypothetical protein
MNRLIFSKNLFQVFIAGLMIVAVPLSVYADEANSTAQLKARRSKPTFFEQTRKGQEERQKEQGFAASFLSDALSGVADPLGGTGGSASGLSNADFQGISNTSFNIPPNSPSTSGTFTRTSITTGSFSSTNGTVSIGNLNLNSQPLTLSQGGATYSSTNYGFSGNYGFAVFAVNGQTTTFVVDNLPRNSDTVPISQTFTGRSFVTNGLAPDH